MKCIKCPWCHKETWFDEEAGVKSKTCYRCNLMWDGVGIRYYRLGWIDISNGCLVVKDCK